MRKIFIILCCFGILSAYATEMCARDDTVVIPLDATLQRTAVGYNQTEWLWWKTFEYGTVYGAGACLSKKEIMMYSDWNGSGNVPSVLNTASDELIGSSDYYMNADANPDIPDSEKGDYARVYCFSKITHPMSSNWVLNNSGNPTVQSCIQNCMSNFIRFSDLSSTAVKSIGMAPPWEWEDE